MHITPRETREIQVRVVPRHKDLIMEVRNRLENDPASALELMKWLKGQKPRVVIHARTGKVLADPAVDVVLR